MNKPVHSVQSAETVLPVHPSALGARLLILSDLHLEFAAFQPVDPAAYDIAVLAGDVCQGPKAVQWARRHSTFSGRPVVLVPGNHEFYGGERTRTLELLREGAADSNVHLLDRDEVVIDGVRFLGATLWTDFELDVGRGVDIDRAMLNAKRGLNDFAGQIRERNADGLGPSLFTPHDAAREHALSRAWLHERLDAAVDSAVVATVVVTHHSPCSRSMDRIYEGSRLNPCFYSDLPDSFFQSAALWVHGHTHSSADYQYHRTRIVANPRGYVRWDGRVENAGFKHGLVITLEPGGRHD